MKNPLILSAAIAAAFLSSCNPERGKPRKEQLENTAEKLEAKAEEVLDNVEQTAAFKEEQASEIREEKGNETVAKALEKAADTTRKIGKLRAEQLERQAEKVRDQKD
jgi:ABC-type multidrug transport system fused ATPase/permease subunit